jgi:hypothetical protein
MDDFLEMLRKRLGGAAPTDATRTSIPARPTSWEAQAAERLAGKEPGGPPRPYYEWRDLQADTAVAPPMGGMSYIDAFRQDYARGKRPNETQAQFLDRMELRGGDRAALGWRESRAQQDVDKTWNSGLRDTLNATLPAGYSVTRALQPAPNMSGLAASGQLKGLAHQDSPSNTNIYIAGSSNPAGRALDAVYAAVEGNSLGEDRRRTLTHEYGHAYHASELGGRQDLGQFIVPTTPPSNPAEARARKGVGYYSQTNVQEGVAEAYADAMGFLQRTVDPSMTRDAFAAELAKIEARTPGTGGIVQRLLAKDVFANHPGRRFYRQ